jgi:hypothetical protein
MLCREFGRKRNTRVFRNTTMFPELVAAVIKEEVAQSVYAHTQNP